MNGQDFLRISNEAFVPFLKQLGFSVDKPSISGRYYRVSFTGSAYYILVSYEPGDEVFFTMIFTRKDGKLSNIDNRAETLRLADLNNRYMTVVTIQERLENERFFESIKTNDRDERHLLKIAKELRLVLPKYIHCKDVPSN